MKIKYHWGKISKSSNLRTYINTSVFQIHFNALMSRMYMYKVHELYTREIEHTFNKDLQSVYTFLYVELRSNTFLRIK